MSHFLNYENGDVSIDTFRHVDATGTTVEDILETCERGEDASLTANIDIWASDQINNMWGRVSDGLDEDEIEDYVFSSNDFVELLEEIGVDVADLGFLRDLQRDFVDDYLDS